ncbi:porin [Billgrantia gudaonensis]|uniref:Outer membrane protein (Porin) n=1 Tax=Billgrantia gudaonensis TaxID=376427 RepID=A0A1G9BM76_9GAMM|nr:porin [Halomonas gudaonensis]SDK40596.1 Outer membrane protein (porin) [Halomonas gudaonensis]
MKKTLLATAIAGAMVASAAQAATLYDQDGKSIDISGRIGVGVESDYEGNSDFVSAGSRLKLDVANQVSDDLRFFGHVEWRFNADERDTDSGFDEVRHAWIGAESANWGTLQAGNFDNIYKLQVFQAFDYYAMSAGYGFHAPGDNGRGDAIAYITPNLSGFQAALQAKHYSQSDLEPQRSVDFDIDGLADGTPVTGTVDVSDGVTNDLSSEVLFAGTVSYEVGGLRLAAGLTESDEEVVDPNNGEFDAGYNAGLSGIYAFNDMFTLRVGFEDQNPTEQATYDNEQKVYGIGGLLSVSDQLTLSADYYRKDRGSDHELDYDSDELAFGAYYRVADNFDIFTEFHDKDRKEVDGEDETYAIVGSRYFF